jgi:hypothetical protein
LTAVNAVLIAGGDGEGIPRTRNTPMSVQQIDKGAWTVFFDTFSKTLPGKRAEVEVASLELGDQIAAEWLPLIGIVYDPKDQLIEIAMEGLDHMILKPREVYVDFEVGSLISLEIINGDGVREIIKLKDPVALPAPEKSSSRE